MENFYIDIDGVTKRVNELSDVSDAINTVASKVSDIARDLGNIGLGELSGAMTTMETRLITHKTKAKDLSVVLNAVLKEYLITEKNIQSLRHVVRSPAKSFGLQIMQDISEEISSKKEFFQNIQDQYGFDDKTMKIMEEIYGKINDKYGDKGSQYVDWMFFRALSQVGGYDDDNFSGIKDAANIWKQGAGNAYHEESHKKFYINELGISEEDYEYLKYNLRMQHNISSSPDIFNSTCVEGLDDDKRDSWRNNMQTGLGLDDLSDEDLQNQINGLYNMYNNKGDFSHMCYTLSGCLNDDWGGVDNSWRKRHTEGWESSDTRKDVIGWLGDATIITDNQGTSFGSDDYIADLDADNIYNRIDYDNGVTAMDAFNNYYEDMANSGDSDFRGKEFLENNPYEVVQEKILDKLDISLEDMENNAEYSDTAAFLERLKNLSEGS